MLSQIDPPAVCHVKIAALPTPLVLKVGTYCPFPFFVESIYASPWILVRTSTVRRSSFIQNEA